MTSHSQSKKTIFLLTFLASIFASAVCPADETDLFTPPVPPDVLLILDASESMKNDPAGNPCSTPGCSKLDIAKKAVSDLLDANGDGVINTADEENLKVRFGYMRISGAANPGAAALVKDLGSGYAEIVKAVSYESAGGGSPLASTFTLIGNYLEGNKAKDPAKSCRRKIAVLFSDAQDLYACNGSGTPSPDDQYKRRKVVVAGAAALLASGYRVFVVDFGPGMTAELKNTLNWIAYFGGSDNSSSGNSGKSGALKVSVDPCGEPHPINDPAKSPLGGYTYPAPEITQLRSALRQLGAKIKTGIFSFSGISIPPVQTAGENFLYEASFQPADEEPFWRGYLRKYELLPDDRTQLWEAGSRLEARRGETRNIVTHTGLSQFESVSRESLGAASEAERDFIVDYISGTANPDGWKLGDIFHSNPVAVGSPSFFFDDFRSPAAFAAFRENQKNRPRMVFVGANDGQFHAFSIDGEEKWSFIPPNLLPKLRLLAHSHPLRGDGRKVHRYFVDGPVTAADVWLGKGTGTSKKAQEWETLLVFGEGRGTRDGENTPAYLWSASQSCEKEFSPGYDSGHPYYCGYYAFNVTNTATALPEFKWLLKTRPGDGAYFGEPWSRMAIGRVLMDGRETWAGFIGGGFNPAPSGEGSYPHRGKGFFVVRLSDGAVVWSRTRGDNELMNSSIPAAPAPVDTDGDGFIDTVYIGDLGGNVWRFKFCAREDEEDAVSKGVHCGIGDWGGELFFRASGGFARPIFTTATVASDSQYIWVFWGTGDKDRPADIPQDAAVREKLIALRDDNRRSHRDAGDLEDVTRDKYRGGKPGWFADLLERGEKVISNPTVFGGAILFTTYTPAVPGSDPCTCSGTAHLYALAMMPLTINGKIFLPAAGVLSDPVGDTGGNRRVVLEAGFPAALTVSQRPGSEPESKIYISMSGEAEKAAGTFAADVESSPLGERLKDTPPRAHMIHWKDRRIR